MFSIGIKNYKSFGDQPVWLEWKPITVLIGKNNSGKSSIIEIIAKIIENVDYNFAPEKHHRNNNGSSKKTEIYIKSYFDKLQLNRVFKHSTSGGSIGGPHGKYGESYIGSRVEYMLITSGISKIINIEKKIMQQSPFMMHLQDWGNYEQVLGRSLHSPIAGKNFHWVIPERQVSVESKNDTPQIIGNGQGLTNAIQTFLHHRNFSETLVEKDLLDSLNEIFSPDYLFTRITTQHTDNSYEIFVEEGGRKLPLSNCGTGIKTVFLILSMITLVPTIEKSDLSNYIFAFEELENNLHPQLLRRLLSFVTKKCEKNKFSLILTTHSNVTIDYFSTVSDAQILHITNSAGQSNLKKVQTFFDSKNVLTDLDIRPSDLLQANGVIWVEGPSDRILLNKWISEWAGETKLHEGTHYQILFYGGRLLSHLAAEQETDHSLINMLRVNTNAAILIDSDKRQDTDELNSTKKRLLEEFKSFEGFSWITAGREIENYYPKSVVSDKFNLNDLESYDNYSSFFDAVDKSSPEKGTKLAKQKPKLASDLIEGFDITKWQGVLDLNQKMTELISEVKKWNNIK